MKETYPPLDSVEYCRACGESTNFDSEDASVRARYTYSCKSQQDANGRYVIHEEWMTRECRVCGFKWRETVLEAL